jgi:hypothetical protein
MVRCICVEHRSQCECMPVVSERFARVIKAGGRRRGVKGSVLGVVVDLLMLVNPKVL